MLLLLWHNCVRSCVLLDLLLIVDFKKLIDSHFCRRSTSSKLFWFVFVFSLRISCFNVCLQARLLLLHVLIRVYRHVYSISRILYLPCSILDDPMFHCMLTRTFTVLLCFATYLQTRLLHLEVSSSLFGIPTLVRR